MTIIDSLFAVLRGLGAFFTMPIMFFLLAALIGVAGFALVGVGIGSAISERDPFRLLLAVGGVPALIIAATLVHWVGSSASPVSWG